MKNLNLLYTKTFLLEKCKAQQIVLDTNTTNVAYLSDGKTIFKHSPANDEPQQIYEQPDSTEIRTFEHLNLNNELCIATTDGDVIVLNLQTMQSESVTFCDGGIETMSWSPDQEIVTFVTKSKLLVVMNGNYDPIYEHSLDDQSFGDQEFITVGWGKKETQFHGTDGKQAAKQKLDLGVEVSLDEIDRRISIVWRGDGEYFAVSFVGINGRMFKVYDKEGRLQFTSEKLNGLESSIYWRPSGTWIAIPQVLQNKYIIVLFEKNGLKHREIVMPFQMVDEQIVRLIWSSDSDVLAIETWCKVREKSLIYLYTMANYHWYVKQTLEFDTKICAIQWDNRFSEGKSLHVLLESGAYAIYRWEYTISHSPIHHPSGESIVGVIDGKSILLTNFQKAVIPPPMYAERIQSTDHQFNYVGFLQQSSSSGNKIFAITSNNQFATYNWKGPGEILCLDRINVPIENDTGSQLYLNHWIWLTDDIVVVVGGSSKLSKTMPSSLYLLTINRNDAGVKFDLRDTREFTGTIGAMCPVQQTDNNCNRLIVHETNGAVSIVSVDRDTLSLPSILYDLNVFCESICAISLVENQQNVFALKYKQTLYFNDQKVATDITSMFLCQQFLAITTLDQLKFCQLTNGTIINERQIERGGKLIAIVPNDSRVVLQMPRGNLEAIQPRLLSLCIIGQLLDDGNYYKAFDVMRKQRINLNLLVDHNPEKFLSEINHFISDINISHWLNLFLSDLQNNDVTLSMYSSNYINRKTNANDSIISNKIQFVCEQMCGAMQAQNSNKFLLPIITAHVKRDNLEAALSMIWSLKKDEAAAASPTNLTDNNSVTSQDALKYLLYLVNVNDLYNVALGMYDFDLVLFVATKSQKDPKEFLPFLNELRQYDDVYRKYKIDLHLKRYEKALQHIVECGTERIDEALELISKHALYTPAMELYDYKRMPECYRNVVLAFAEHLRVKGKFVDACLMYERGGDLSQAILTAKNIMDWRKCLSLSKKLGYTDDDVQHLISSLIPALQESGNHIDAANLIIDYQKNYELGIQVLCDGHLYSSALYEAGRYADHLKESLIRPHLDQYADTLTTTLCTNYDLYQKHCQRLHIVRKEKALQKENGLNGIDNDIDECDLLSDTSSLNSSRFTQSSNRTGKSHRSSKNRRKHERKLLNLKEGNPFEDVALIDSLHTLAIGTYAQQDHIRSICKVLIEFQMDKNGSELQRIFSDFLLFIKNTLDDIWIPEMITSGQLPTDLNQIDYVQYQDEQHYTLIKLHQRFKPQLNLISWEFDALK